MLEIAIALATGLLVGSFLNVCIYRLPRDLSVVRPRSYCPACNAPLAWYDNVPVLSYILLRGRCRNCGARISLRYPAVEVVTALLFVLIVVVLGVNLRAARLCLFSSMVLSLVVCDIEQRILPDELTLGGLLAGLLSAIFVPMDPEYAHSLLPADWDISWLSLGESVLGAAFASGILWGVGSLYQKVRHKEGLGLGDVKMMAMVGSFLGISGAFQTLILGSLAGTVIGTLYIFLRKKDWATYELPFGAFLGVAAVLLAFQRAGVSSSWLPLLR